MLSSAETSTTDRALIGGALERVAGRGRVGIYESVLLGLMLWNVPR